ncbi:MAG: DNA alkylation repair protein [Chloroflexi bacterium]|nr:DNA alkylation repair protein [Chloroflexota bacterium]
MPALDIAQIRAEAAEVAKLYGDPEAFALNARDFFQVHSAPSFRRSDVVTTNAPLKSYDTPPPVIRALVNAVRKMAAVNDAHTLLVAERLWADPVREQRRLAVDLLGLVVAIRPDESYQLMMRWLIGLDDLELIGALATEVSGPWLTGDLYGRLDQVRQWVNSPYKHQRQFGVMTLAPLAKLRNFGDTSAVLEVMTGVMRENDVEVRKSVAHVIRDLSANGPGEVARFLGSWADTIDKNTNWIVRHALEKLDTDTRTQISSILRGQGRE